MSIFKVLEDKIKQESENFSEYLSDKKGDVLKGSEFMLYALSRVFNNKSPEEIDVGIVDSSYRGETYDYGIVQFTLLAQKTLLKIKSNLIFIMTILNSRFIFFNSRKGKEYLRQIF